MGLLRALIGHTLAKTLDDPYFSINQYRDGISRAGDNANERAWRLAVMVVQNAVRRGDDINIMLGMLNRMHEAAERRLK